MGYGGNQSAEKHSLIWVIADFPCGKAVLYVKDHIHAAYLITETRNFNSHNLKEKSVMSVFGYIYIYQNWSACLRWPLMLLSVEGEKSFQVILFYLFVCCTWVKTKKEYWLVSTWNHED